MIITAIEKRQGSPRRFNVFTGDGEFAFCAEKSTLAAHKLAVGVDMDVKHMREAIADDEYAAALERMYTFLESRMRAGDEITRKLKALGYTDKVTARVQAKLAELGLVNDALFAQLWTQQRIRSRSVRVVQGELKQNGIAQEHISSVRENADPALELEKCVKLARKYFEREGDEKDARRKASAALARRGYDWDTIKKAFDAMGQDTDEFVD